MAARTAAPASKARCAAVHCGRAHAPWGPRSAPLTHARLALHEPDRYLPIANISRIMKRALPANAKIAKDAKETVQECVSEFISFITSEYVHAEPCCAAAPSAARRARWASRAGRTAWVTKQPGRGRHAQAREPGRRAPPR